VALLFANTINVNEMWNILITSYRENLEIKKTKITGLGIRFENFKLEHGETIKICIIDLYMYKMSLMN
jgi:hypothetical protein